MNEQWQELKETIIEMRDNDGTGTQQEVCKFLVNYMEILEKQIQEPTPNDDYFRKKAGVVISQLRADRDRLEDELAKREQEPSGDLISRQDVIKVLTKNRVHFYDMVKITSELKKLPSVKQEPKTSHWDDCGTYIECFKYGCLAPSIEFADGVQFKKSSFCPRLQSTQESEDKE